MSTLTGKAFYGTPTGHITVNGQPGSLRRFKRVMGFVPQVRLPPAGGCSRASPSS